VKRAMLVCLAMTLLGCVSLPKMRRQHEYRLVHEEGARLSSHGTAPVIVRELAVRFVAPGTVPTSSLDERAYLVRLARDAHARWMEIFLGQQPARSWRFAAVDEPVTKGLVLESELFFVGPRSRGTETHYLTMTLRDAERGTIQRRLRIETTGRLARRGPAIDEAGRVLNAMTNATAAAADMLAITSPNGPLEPAAQTDAAYLALRAERTYRAAGDLSTEELDKRIAMAHEALPEACKRCGLESNVCGLAVGHDTVRMPSPVRADRHRKLEQRVGEVPPVCVECDYEGPACEDALAPPANNAPPSSH
jgi:hypothetical protein